MTIKDRVANVSTTHSSDSRLFLGNHNIPEMDPDGYRQSGHVSFSNRKGKTLEISWEMLSGNINIKDRKVVDTSYQPNGSGYAINNMDYTSIRDVDKIVAALGFAEHQNDPDENPDLKAQLRKMLRGKIEIDGLDVLSRPQIKLLTGVMEKLGQGLRHQRSDARVYAVDKALSRFTPGR